MEIIIKTPEEIEKMRIAGKLAGEVLEMIGEYVKPGVSTEKLNQICHDYIVDVQKAIPAPLNYKGFPKSICTSVNHQVCHGIPSDKKILKDGDIINIDVTVIKDGYHGDTSKMFCVGKPSILGERLSIITRKCLFIGIEQVKPGNYTGHIGHAIQKYAKEEGFSVVREYCGHGIGKIFHEDLQILHYAVLKKGIRLKQGVEPRLGIELELGVKLEPGMIFTIEPMINAGKKETKLLNDDWTVVTKDHSLSAQWEHTILVTETGYEILTLRDEEKNSDYIM